MSLEYHITFFATYEWRVYIKIREKRKKRDVNLKWREGKRKKKGNIIEMSENQTYH